MEKSPLKQKAENSSFLYLDFDNLSPSFLLEKLAFVLKNLFKQVKTQIFRRLEIEL